MYDRTPKPARAPARISAATAIIAAETFGDTPFGGWGGERLPFVLPNPHRQRRSRS